MTHKGHRARFPRDEVNAADIPTRHHCCQHLISQDLHRCVGHVEDEIRGKPHRRLERKRMRRACCELEERKLDEWAVLGPVDDGDLDVASEMVSERNQVRT